MLMELLTRLFDILKDSLASFMPSSRFSSIQYFEPEVSLSHSVHVTPFKAGFKCALRSSDVCFCALHIKVTESTVWSITFLRLSGLFLLCASISSSPISITDDVTKTNPFWISLISSFMKWHNFPIFSHSVT